MIQYRDQGAIGALLDEYEKSVKELQAVIRPLDSMTLCKVMDHETKDEDCRSIQTILSHVVRAGYTYMIMVRNHMGESREFITGQIHSDAQSYINDLDIMFEQNVLLFKDYPDMVIEVHDPEKNMTSRWGCIYDVEQLFEHAIVHILRHRRQIERFLNRI